ncbi:MAG: hypothetical protein PSU93_12040 [Methylobacter sp.]|uniref:CopZ zinc binding domain-containing protein n=1 Tax=Candidatus Methylobacter titanis TaxID=3053457 RepID=A0AA43Q6X9_9GAMM|nr:hypothetical protein [Candidatus Methylobacter titanis]
MSNCCSNNSSQSTSQNCSQCGQFCKRVEMRTIYHQVRFPDNQAIAPGIYYFCAAKECTTGYFSITGSIIPKQNLTVHKDIMDDRLCYCFDIDAAQYRSALIDNTADGIKSFIIQKTKSGDCACDIRNPCGQCCLAKFNQLEKEYR